MLRTHFALLLLACPAFPREPLTIVAQFERTYSETAVKEMKNELQSQMLDSGVDLNWRLMGDVAVSDSFPDLVVVKFHGACDATGPSRPWSGKPAALAYTHVTDGRVLPFSDVDCDEIRSFVSARPGAPDFRVSEKQFGRALGRVMAHELHHMLTHSRSHAREGVDRQALSSTELTVSRFR